MRLSQLLSEHRFGRFLVNSNVGEELTAPLALLTDWTALLRKD